MDYLYSNEQIPVVAEFDVVVLGGGPAGISAAVSSSRAGARTGIVERYGYLGGQATGGLVILLVGLTDGKQRIIKGFCEETINRLTQMGAVQEIGRDVLFDAESMKYDFDCSLEENNITPFYNSFASDVVMEEDRVLGIVIDGKSGRRILKAKAFVDATGDGDLAKYCGIPFDMEPKETILPTTLCFRVGGIEIEKFRQFLHENYETYKNLLQSIVPSSRVGGWMHTLNKNEAWFNISHIDGVDTTNSDDLTRAEIIGRRQIQQIMKAFKASIPGLEKAYLIDTASQIGGRESRRIKGLYRFKKEDALKDFDDVIARAPDYTGWGKGSVAIPYRCLIAEKPDNVIFAGRCVSAEHDLVDMFREIPCCMATGQAAGVAASVCSRTSVGVQGVDMREVQDILKKQGTVL